MKKILVTGNAGYIGQHLVKLLNEHGGYHIYGQDLKYMSGDKKQPLYGVNPSCVTSTKTLYKVDFDSVVHLAALVRVGESVEQPSYYYKTNISGSMNQIDNLSYGNFVFASTGAAEKMSSPYAISKKVIEDYVADKVNNFTTFRFYNVVGSEYGIEPTNPDGILSNLIKAKETGTFTIHGNTYDTKDGTCVREYVHVMDICRAIIKATESPTNKIENLAYGDTRTVGEIVDIFQKVNNVNFKIQIGDKREGDYSKYFLTDPSPLMERNYTYEDMFRV